MHQSDAHRGRRALIALFVLAVVFTACVFDSSALEDRDRWNADAIPLDAQTADAPSFEVGEPDAGIDAGVDAADANPDAVDASEDADATENADAADVTDEEVHDVPSDADADVADADAEPDATLYPSGAWRCWTARIERQCQDRTGYWPPPVWSIDGVPTIEDRPTCESSEGLEAYDGVYHWDCCLADPDLDEWPHAPPTCARGVANSYIEFDREE